MKYLLFLLFLLPFASAEIYVLDETILQDTFELTDTVGDDESLTYSIAPGDFKKVTFTLQGNPNFIPRLVLYDPIKEEVTEYINGEKGSELTYEFVSGYYKGNPREYYIIIDTFKNEGDFTFTYKAQAQNDANMHTDASYNFRNGLTITPGSYNGFLGGEDTSDHYKIELKQGQEIDISLSLTDGRNARLYLINGKYETKVNERGILEGEVINAHYKALVDETVYLGIEGNFPYELSVEMMGGTLDGEIIAVNLPEKIEETLPPPPAEPPALEEQIEAVETAEASSQGAVLIVAIVLLVIIAGLAVLFAMKQKKE